MSSYDKDQEFSSPNLLKKLRLHGITLDHIEKLSNSPKIIKKTIKIIEEASDDGSIFEIIQKNIIVPAVEEPFCVKDHFIINCGERAQKGKVKISALNGDFEGGYNFKKFNPRESYPIMILRLSKNSSHEELLKKLSDGQEDPEQLALMDPSAVFHFMSQQPDGPKSAKGLLLTNSVNIFYLLNHIMFVRWHNDGWYITLRFFDKEKRSEVMKKHLERGQRVFLRSSLILTQNLLSS